MTDDDALTMDDFHRIAYELPCVAAPPGFEWTGGWVAIQYGGPLVARVLQTRGFDAREGVRIQIVLLPQVLRLPRVERDAAAIAHQETACRTVVATIVTHTLGKDLL